MSLSKPLNPVLQQDPKSRPAEERQFLAGADTNLSVATLQTPQSARSSNRGRLGTNERVSSASLR
jgi:hypothetical protein